MRIEDLSGVVVEAKDEVRIEDLMPSFELTPTTDVRMRVWSEDLEGLTVECDNGLLVGLNPAPPNSFFMPTLDDDTAYKLLCPSCLHRYWPLYRANPAFLCPSCRKESTDYFVADTFPLWYCASGARLAMDKAVKREERAPQLARVTSADMDTFLKSQDFVATLVSWVEPHAGVLEANLQAWDLADRLDLVFRAWKQARRARRPGKRLSAFRALETAFSQDVTWTRYPERLTGQARPVKPARAGSE